MSSALGPPWLMYWIHNVCTGSTMSALGLHVYCMGATLGTTLGLHGYCLCIMSTVWGLLYSTFYIYYTESTMSTVPDLLGFL